MSEHFERWKHVFALLMDDGGFCVVYAARFWRAKSNGRARVLAMLSYVYNDGQTHGNELFPPLVGSSHCGWTQKCYFGLRIVIL